MFSANTEAYCGVQIKQPSSKVIVIKELRAVIIDK